MMPVLRVNNVNLNYEKLGDGEAIVFLHGYTGSSRDWERQAAILSDSYKVIAIDNRGHGKSEAPKAEEDYSIRIFSEDVYALLRACGVKRSCLVGHSMGGFIALQLALGHPELVRGLVLVDTSSGDFERPPDYRTHRAKLDELARTEGLEVAFEYDAENNPMRIDRFKRHPELKGIARRKTVGTSVDGYVYVARSFDKWQPVTKRLHEIEVPTLIFLGEEDTGFIKASQILKASIGGAELVVIPGATHNPHEEAPDLFNRALLDFLPKIVW